MARPPKIPYVPPVQRLRTGGTTGIARATGALGVPKTKNQGSRALKKATRKATVHSGITREVRIKRIKALVEKHGPEKGLRIASANGKIHVPTGAKFTPTPPKPHVPKPFKMERAHFSPVKPRKLSDVHIGVAPGRDLRRRLKPPKI